MTGFSFISPRESDQYSKSAQIVGKAFAADYAIPTPAAMTAAVSDMQAAYIHARDRQSPDSFSPKFNMNAGQLGGEHGGECDQFTPGVYTFDTTVSINSDLYFLGSGEAEGQGNLDAFIVQITGTLALKANVRVILQNGALAQNIIWQVKGAVTIGADSHMEGIILGETTVNMITGSSLTGGIFAQTAVDLGQATISGPL